VAVVVTVAAAVVLPLWHLPAAVVAEELPHQRSPMGVAVTAVAAELPLWRLLTTVATVLPLMVAEEMEAAL
jgi:hypothetical protein